MKKLLLVLAVLLAAAAGAVAVAAPTGAAEVAALSAVTTTAADECNFLVAGKNATADGSVLLEYNNDWSATNFAYARVVPATSTTYKYVKMLTKGDVAEGGINEYQLAIVFGVATGLDRAVTTGDPYVGKGYGNEMWDLVLQKCRTAHEAIDLLEQMSATKGFSAAAAGSLAVADPNEAWAFELLGGHHWVAARVPDNAYYEQPNMLRIRQIDLNDPANFRGSADLEQFAISVGRYDPASGPFDVAWAYGDRARLQDPYNTNRLWAVLHRFTPSLNADVAMPYAQRQVFVVPDQLLTRQDFMAVDREHYEGTVLDQTQGYTLMSPHNQTDRPICYSTTDYGTVYQLRNWLPNEVGGVMWLAMSRPCSSAFVPLYAGISSLASTWTSKAAYNGFRAVAESLDKNGTVNGQIRYKYYIPLVRGTYGAFESEVSSAQASTESTAAGLPLDQRITYLTDYTAQRAAQAYNLALSLPAQMP